MFEYEVNENHRYTEDRSRLFEITAQVHPIHHGATHHPALADALLDVLNNRHFCAHYAPIKSDRDTPETCEVGVSFASAKEPKATHIRARFFLGEPDHETIQRVAEQAQDFLTETMTRAVDVFEMVMAVGTVDPYRVHLRQHPAIEESIATHVTAHRKALHCVVSPEPAVRA